MFTLRPQGTSIRTAAVSLVTTAAAGLVLAASGASASSPAEVGAGDRCDPVGPASLAYYDARRPTVKKGTLGVSYERSDKGLPQRTIYTESAGYVVSVCLPSGAVREEEYQPVAGDEEPRVVSIYDVAPGGVANGVNITYAESEPKPGRLAPAPAEQRITPRVGKTPTVMSPEAKALVTWNLKPGSPARVAKARAAATPVDGPVVTPFYSAANKCSHNSGIAGPQRRGSRSFSYYSALGPSVATIVNSGARAFPDVWNYCGWTVGSGLNAVYAGDITQAAFTINPADGINQIGWHTPGDLYCGNVVALGCNFPGNLVLSGSEWVIGSNDIALSPLYPYANGAVAGYLDLQSLVAHEFGHSWGFMDFYNDPYGENHVMYGGAIPWANDDRRYLAYGDYQLMRNVYP